MNLPLLHSFSLRPWLLPILRKSKQLSYSHVSSWAVALLMQSPGLQYFQAPWGTEEWTQCGIGNKLTTGMTNAFMRWNRKQIRPRRRVPSLEKDQEMGLHPHPLSHQPFPIPL